MNRWSATLAAAALVGAMAIAQQNDSAQTSALAAYIDAHHADALALLERVVNINSGTQNLGGVREVGRVFRAELDALGFRTEWVDGAAWRRAGHLVADHPGPGPRVLIVGHLDTVFETDSPFQKFERIGPHEARGPGIIDMKGGGVVALQALKALDAIGELKRLNVIVVMTGDEESPGRPLELARAALVEAGRGADVAIGFEDGPGDPRLAVTARRGTSQWTLRVTGNPAHSSQIFREDIGPGAIFEAARILNTFRETLSREEHLTFNPGVIAGGTSVQYDAARSRGSGVGKNNVIAGEVVVSGDLRALSVEQFRRAKEAMQRIVAASLRHTSAVLSFDDGYPPMAPAEGNRRLLDLYSRASRDLRLGEVTAVSPDRAGAADVSFLAGRVPMILDGVGLMGRDGHTSKETADLRTLASQAKRAAVLLSRLARAESISE